VQYCLKCLEPLNEKSELQWHLSCSKKFFNRDNPPLFSLDKKTFEELAIEASRVKSTITGVQRKLSIHLSNNENSGRLTLVNYPTGYILKAQSLEYEELPELEAIVMHLADKANINCVENGLMKIEDGSLVYITKRIDRVFEDDYVEKIHMEDFCQLTERLTEDKYKSSYEQCAKVVKKYSSQIPLDLAALFYLILFSFVTGNSDMHLKNFSLYTPMQNLTILAPAYDLLPVSLIIDDSEQMALTLLGKRSNIKGSDFLKLAENFSLDPKIAPRLIKRLINLEETFNEYIKRSFISSDYKTSLSALIGERLKNLKD
jgi:serine/threonine-protein kinase HipA